MKTQEENFPLSLLWKLSLRFYVLLSLGYSYCIQCQASDDSLFPNPGPAHHSDQDFSFHNLLIENKKDPIINSFDLMIWNIPYLPFNKDYDLDFFDVSIVKSLYSSDLFNISVLGGWPTFGVILNDQFSILIHVNRTILPQNKSVLMPTGSLNFIHHLNDCMFGLHSEILSKDRFIKEFKNNIYQTKPYILGSLSCGYSYLYELNPLKIEIKPSIHLLLSSFKKGTYINSQKEILETLPPIKLGLELGFNLPIHSYIGVGHTSPSRLLLKGKSVYHELLFYGGLEWKS